MPLSLPNNDCFTYSLRASTLVSYNRPFNVLTRNMGSTQQSTSIMSCLISRMVSNKIP
jgi:hypothetical protein